MIALKAIFIQVSKADFDVELNNIQECRKKNT
jgi:hypothetical protein